MLRLSSGDECGYESVETRRRKFKSIWVKLHRGQIPGLPCNLVSQQIDADADQGGCGPAAAVYVFMEEEFGGDRVGDQGEGGSGRADQAEIHVIQGEEQGEERNCHEEDSGDEERGSDDGANGTPHAGTGANIVEIAHGLHGRGG